MSEQVPFGVQQGPEQKAFQPVPVQRRYDSLAAVAVMVACIFGVFVIVRLVRFADAADNRLSNLELNQKVTQLQAKMADADKRAEGESQRLTGMMENHNKLVQALTQVFGAQEAKVAALDAKVTAAEFARTNVVEKVEKEKRR